MHFDKQLSNEGEKKRVGENIKLTLILKMKVLENEIN
jgi:hypothetical protein